MLTGFFTSRARFFLIAGDAGVTCVARHVARARLPFFAGWQDREAQKHLGELLAHYRRAPVTFYADNLAQDLRNELLPALNFVDRVKLVRRRLKQAFPQARYSAGKLLSRTQVLFAGLNDNARAGRVVRAHQAALAGDRLTAAGMRADDNAAGAGSRRRMGFVSVPHAHRRFPPDHHA